MLLCIPRSGVKAKGAAKDVESPCREPLRHGVSHPPGKELDGIAAEGVDIRLEVVHGRNSTSHHDPEGGQKPEAKREDRLTGEQGEA